MDISSLQLTSELRKAVSAHPGEPIRIADEEAKKIYILVEEGVLPELEEEVVRARLEEGFAAIDRGEVEQWDSASIKEEGRRILERRRLHE